MAPGAEEGEGEGASESGAKPKARVGGAGSDTGVEMRSWPRAHPEQSACDLPRPVGAAPQPPQRSHPAHEEATWPTSHASPRILCCTRASKGRPSRSLVISASISLMVKTANLVMWSEALRSVSWR